MTPQNIRRQVRDRARGCCEYCQSQERFSPTPFSVEHIQPICQGGNDELPNLAWSCQGCNNHKHTKTHAFDPVTRQEAKLYHPRQEQWSKHFAWYQDFLIVLGLTPTGRATVERLRMNRQSVVNLRQVLSEANLHPP